MDFWWFARGTLVFFRLKRGLNRRFQRCFGAVFGFLETIGVGGALNRRFGTCFKEGFDYLGRVEEGRIV